MDKIIAKYTESKNTSCWRNNWNLKKSTAEYCKYITYLHLLNHYLYNVMYNVSILVLRDISFLFEIN